MVERRKHLKIKKKELRPTIKKLKPKKCSRWRSKQNLNTKNKSKSVRS
jgi:hypothetical protein